MNIQNKKPVFSTDNLPLATFLKAKGCRLLHITRKTPKHAFFNFEETSERKKLTKNFWDGNALAEPRSFCIAQRELKTFLYDKSYLARSQAGFKNKNKYAENITNNKKQKNC